MGLSAPVSALGKCWALLKGRKRKRIFLLVTHLFYYSYDVSRCLAELFSWLYRYQTCQVTLLFFFKESCLQSHSSSYALLLLRGITDRSLLSMAHVMIG